MNWVQSARSLARILSRSVGVCFLFVFFLVFANGLWGTRNPDSRLSRWLFSVGRSSSGVWLTDLVQSKKD